MVTARELSAGYSMDGRMHTVFTDVSFSLEPGQCLAVVGASGCGKSTLLHILAGLLSPTTGEVFVGGRRVGAPGRPSRSGHAACMFQSDLLLPWKTVLANATFAARMARDPANGSRRPARAALESRARALLDDFGLGECLGALPHQLSGGMRQRVALARTLLLGRGLVLLDEPFGSLDAITRSDLQDWLLQVMLTHPATWVLVTHDVTEAVFLADQVAILGGRPTGVRGWVSVPVERARRRFSRDGHDGRLLRKAVGTVRHLLATGRTG